LLLHLFGFVLVLEAERLVFDGLLFLLLNRLLRRVGASAGCFFLGHDCVLSLLVLVGMFVILPLGRSVARAVVSGGEGSSLSAK